MSLSLQASVLERGVELDLTVGDGETVALLGPNGAGKSTALAVISGLLRPDHGVARLGDKTLFDIDASGTSRVWVPPHAREIALLAQDPLLFPHMTALDNVAFGPRSARHHRKLSREIATRWLLEVDAAGLADRKPSQLSGGQGQRIAVARALAAEPRLLLLDEPMAALDVTVAPALRQMLRRMLVGRSVLMVTHDVLDAVLLADRVLIMDEGRVVEAGPTAETLSRPRTPFTARIAGLNMVRGTFSGSGVRASDGTSVVGQVNESAGLRAGDPAVAVFSPGAVSVFRDPPTGSPRNVLQVSIAELEPHADRIRVRAPHLSADITPAALAELAFAPGEQVFFVVKASAVDIYPA